VEELACESLGEGGRGRKSGKKKLEDRQKRSQNAIKKSKIRSGCGKKARVGAKRVRRRWGKPENKKKYRGRGEA